METETLEDLKKREKERIRIFQSELEQLLRKHGIKLEHGQFKATTITFTLESCS